MYYFFDFLTIFSIGVALPVLIVWIIMRKSTNKTNKLSQIIITAIEKNINIDIESLTKVLHNSPQKHHLKIAYRKHLFMSWNCHCCILYYFGILL